nr:MAG TPA: hypothetical protein [Caudoviricetes sp.]
MAKNNNLQVKDNANGASAQAIERLNNVLQLFDCTQVKTEAEAKSYLLSLNKVNDTFLLPYCRIAYLVKEKELYKKSKCKTFEAWFKNNFNLGKTTASYRARVGALVTEKGDKTVFASDKGDFNYTQLLKLIELGYNDFDKIEELLDNDIINYNMSVKEIAKALKPAEKDLSNLNGTININNKESNEKEEKPEKVENVQSVEPLDVARKSALYKKYEPLFAKLVLLSLNNNDEKVIKLSLETSIEEFKIVEDIANN